MIDFSKKQEELMAVIQEVFQEKKSLCEKNNRASSFIDPEFFDFEDSEDKIVCEQIQKRLQILCEKIQESIKNSFENEENSLSFQVFKNSQSPFESLCYLYGYIEDEESSKKLNLQKGKIPKSLQDSSCFFLIVDTKNGPSLLPWRV